MGPWPSEFGMFQESSSRSQAAEWDRSGLRSWLCLTLAYLALSAPEVVLGELTEGIRRCFNKLGTVVHLLSLGELCSWPWPLWPSLLPFPGLCPYPSAMWHHAVILKSVQTFEHNLNARTLPSPLPLPHLPLHTAWFLHAAECHLNHASDGHRK